MRIIILAICLLSINNISYGQQNIYFGTSNQQGINILYSGLDRLIIKNYINELKLSTIKHPEGNFILPSISNMISNNDPGLPALPCINQLIRIPEGATITISTEASHYTDIDLNTIFPGAKLFPYQPSVSKSHVGPIPFHYNKTQYTLDGFTGPQRAIVTDLGHMRQMRIGRLSICPFEYNAATNTLRVYYEMQVSIEFQNANVDKTNELQLVYSNNQFNGPVHFLLNDEAFHNDKDVITESPIKYVIVADTMFYNALQPFVQWKTKKGFKVIQAYTNNPAVGSTSISIKNYLASLYNAASPSDPAPSYILIVGDIAQVPAFAGTTATHPTDLYYAEYTGDFMPEVYYGRFSATTVAELQVQIDKTLEYEQFLFTDTNWLNKVVMIAGVDGTFGPTHANGQINYGTSYYFNSANGLTSMTHLYPASGNEDALIRTEIGEGVAFANYTAHGWDQGWGDPSFSNTDIPAMGNAHKYPLMIGNACLTNKFDEAVCFGEALLRAQDKGAIGYIGGSNSTYWDEDFYWGCGVGTVSANPTYAGTTLGSYDRTWHIFGEPSSEWFPAQGQMTVAGNLAVAVGSAGSAPYYWEIYHLMGDPSLMVYYGAPPTLTVNHPGLIPLGQTTINVTTEPNTYIGISMNGVWHGAGFSDGSGNAVITIDPFTVPGTASIVGTKQNRKPYIGSFVVASPSGPYVMYDSHDVKDPLGNNNLQADYAEEIDLDVVLKNYGLMDDSTVYAILSTNDTMVTIIDSVAIWGIIPDSDTLGVFAAFNFKVDTLINDMHVVAFQISVRDSSGNIWNSNLNVTLHAPNLLVTSLILSDVSGGNGNGRLDPGETIEVYINTQNIGHCDAYPTDALLSSLSPLINITQNYHSFDTLFASTSEAAHYVFVLDPATPLGTIINIRIDPVCGLYTANKVFSLMVGQVDEDWEGGDFLQYAWQSEGNAPWIITSGTPYEGTFAAMSGDINDNETSVLSISGEVLIDDSISFYKKVSCEEPWSQTDLYDYLDFQIDGISQGSWGGELGWTREAFAVSAGQHTFKWVYIKDYSVSSGDDAAWVDFILFPPITVVSDLNETSMHPEVFTSPNPSNGVFTLSFPLTSNDESLISIYDYQGRLVYSEVVKSNGTNMQTETIDISSCAQGVYSIIISNNNMTQTCKIIKAQ